MPSVTDLVTTLNIKTTEIKNKIPDITSQDAKAILYRKARKSQNKMPDTSTLVRKADNNTKTTEIRNNRNKMSDVSGFKTKLRRANTKVTSKKKRQENTETKLKQRINSNRKLIGDLKKMLN